MTLTENPEIDSELQSKRQKKDKDLELINETLSLETDNQPISGIDLIQKIQKDVERVEQCDTPINESLAKIFNSVAQGGLSLEKEKDRLKDIIRPENCEMMGKVKINFEVWQKMTQDKKANDLSYQAILDN